MDTDNRNRAEKISGVAEQAKKRTDIQETMIKKLQVSVLEIAGLNKRVSVLVSFQSLIIILIVSSETVCSFLTIFVCLFGMNE